MSRWESQIPEIKKFLDEGKDYGEIAEILGLSRSGFRALLCRLRKDGLLPPADGPDTSSESPPEIVGYKESMEIGADGTYKSDKPLWMTLEQVKDPEYLLRAHGFEPDAWELVSAKNNIWNTNDKIHGIQTLYGSKITVKPKETGKSDEEWQQFFLNLSNKYQSPVHDPTHYSRDGKMLEINIADLHLGKLCWVGDSNDHYNEEVAQERFFYIINNILTRTSGCKFEYILFVWCNDFFHFDGPGKMTTNGTPQDTNLQFERMFEIGAEMLVKGIDLLSQIAPVKTMYVASNHDRLISYFMTQYLFAWYRDNPHVTVDNSALSRKAVRFGNCLIGFTHGDKEKARIGKWLQVERAKDWGETIFREVHAAHIHSDKVVNEDNGQIIRYVSSPTGTDRWHYNSAYVGAIQKAQTFVWDREFGLEDIMNTTILGGRVAI